MSEKEPQMKNALKGKCPKCGQKYYGWALLNPKNKNCEKCGTELIIEKNKKNLKPIKIPNLIGEGFYFL